MNIPINRNIDEFKDDFFKGLTFRQTCFSAITLFSGTAGFVIVNVAFGIPQAISIYVTIMCAAPWAVWGFIRIKGMSAKDYLQKRFYVMAHPIFLYRSAEGLCKAPPEETKNGKKKCRREKEKVGLCSPQGGEYLDYLQGS